MRIQQLPHAAAVQDPAVQTLVRRLILPWKRPLVTLEAYFALAVLRGKVGAGKVPLQAPGDAARRAALPAAAVAHAPLHTRLLYLQRHATPEWTLSERKYALLLTCRGVLFNSQTGNRSRDPCHRGGRVLQ